MNKNAGYLIRLGLLSLVAVIGFDLFLHAGILSPLYKDPGTFLLPPETAFRLIPLGYLSFALLIVLLEWIIVKLGVIGFKAGLKYGLLLGFLVWASLCLGLASIVAAPYGLLVGWTVGQAVELGLAGAIIGAGLAVKSLKEIGLRVLAIFVGCVILSVILQNILDGRVTHHEKAPFVVVLGIAQDGGVPQAGTKEHQGWAFDTQRRRVACLGLVDPVSGQRWMFDATPDFPEQLHMLDEIVPVEGKPGLSGIFLTHAHIGHYTGLMFLGYESLGAKEVSVYAMPRMRRYLGSNGPWDQLVRYRNIALKPLENGVPVPLNERLSVTPFLVPHRQEYTEVIGFRIDGPGRSVLFIPDIDSWEEWDEAGTRIEDMIASVDVAFLDGTFYSGDEMPGRDLSGIPHPFITHSMNRFDALPLPEKAKVRFIHLNHTNPALWPESEARSTIERHGFEVADEGERVSL